MSSHPVFVFPGSNIQSSSCGLLYSIIIVTILHEFIDVKITLMNKRLDIFRGASGLSVDGRYC